MKKYIYKVGLYTEVFYAKTSVPYIFTCIKLVSKLYVHNFVIVSIWGYTTIVYNFVIDLTVLVSTSPTKTL